MPILPRRRPTRLDASLYADPGRVFSLTICTAGRKPYFRSADLVMSCVELLTKTSFRCDIKLYAYCFMPDHVHLLAGPEGSSSLIEFVRLWKGVTDHAWRQRGGEQKLWHRSFYDHALRREESIEEAARYILNNPVRAGLVEDWREYPFSGLSYAL